MLIDAWMPGWDARERHEIAVRAPAELVYAALRTADLGGHPLVRAMLALRALPAAIGDRRRFRELRARGREPISLAAFEAQGFRVLEEDAHRELVLGLEGAFWRPGGDLRPVDPAAFRGPVPAGTARAAWNFTVAQAADGTCILRTETRILTGDPSARRRFRLYWTVIRPGSGLIRRLMLRTVRAHAETAAAAARTTRGG